MMPLLRTSTMPTLVAALGVCAGLAAA
eukprot:COSAG06_NODE_26548_length_612_cov_1.077973_1_plen_26_part_10